MRQTYKYIWLRNIALLSICGFLCFSLFPVPPITWRLLFLGTATITIWYNIYQLTHLEKWALTFAGLNLGYYFISFFWLNNPSATQIGNILVTLLSIPLFMTLGRNGVMTERFYLIGLPLLIVSSIIYFESMQLRFLEVFLGREDITNNGSVVFLYILPITLFLKNRYFSYGITLISAYFLMEGAKRGNIICAVPVIILFIVLTFRNRRVRIYEKLIFIVFFLFAISWGIKQFEQNEYLQTRVEQTIEGNSSNRDILYTNAWKVYSESNNLKNIIFGYGFQATCYNQQIGNYVHNDWLEILVDYGAFGAIFYLTIFLLLFQLIRKEKDVQKRYVLIAIALVWFFKSIFSMGFTSDTMFILFLSLGYVCQKSNIVAKVNS